MRRGMSGVTLIELAVASAMAAVLAAMAWPAFDQQLRQGRRADATAALTKLQFAQARHHAAHGLFAPDLATLAAAPRSAEGLYTIELRAEHDGYAAVAHAQGAQARDRGCERIELIVRDGFAHHGPSPRCWGR